MSGEQDLPNCNVAIPLNVVVPALVIKELTNSETLLIQNECFDFSPKY